MEGDKGKNRKVDGEGTSILINDGGLTVEELRITIENKLVGKSPLPASCCIFRVPQAIRKQKEDAYEPYMVSIGPFHRGGDKKFQLMENVKRWYLQCLLSSRTDISLESLIKVVMEFGKSVRDCYADPLDDIGQQDLLEMMILDGCFLLELFRKGIPGHIQNDNDPVFNVSCMRGHLYHDLLLLENQIPWFVLECLYTLTTNRSSQTKIPSLTELVLNFFRQYSLADELMFSHNFKVKSKILHILDLLRKVIVAGFKRPDNMEKKARLGQPKKNEQKLPQRIPSATSLSEAGVQFKTSQNKGDCLMSIQFEDGVFTIPPLGISEGTEPLFRNLIALEQCFHDRPHKITSYAVLMDNLIDTSKDVDFLCEKGILANWLSDVDAAQFFNKLYNETTVYRFYYGGLSKKVNKYYGSKWPKFMEILRRDYFSTPWAIISVIAAFILLVLTVLQTLYTIKQPN